MKLFKMLTLILTVTAITQISADSGKGKVLTAVNYVKQNAVIKFKARQDITNSQFYSLVAKKTGIARDKLMISGVQDSKHKYLSADQLAKFRVKPPRVTKAHGHNPVGRVTRVVTRPVEPVADVTVVPVADVTDDILFGVYRN
jgi:hypothetical protein